MKSNIEIMAEVLPCVRAEIARELINTHKMNQGEVSRILGVSQPAVSQYMRNLRGSKLTYTAPLRQEIKILCERLVSGKTSDLENELYSICKSAIQMRAN